MRRFSFDIICKFSFGMDLECFIPSLPKSKLADSFNLASKLSKLKEAIGVVDNVAMKIIRQRRTGDDEDDEDNDKS
ncbi:hypothetical protein Ahy_A04g017779 [Arachis hypogaea]|uniref:Uncharacterized protein n=1 Tax=Arachis hypogaea TaxID=3818 RepID=A0A445DC10_ARAHY|nr:hypothetical protein Ahy_A04g017779 [Arachis hypogaea]